MNDNDPGWRARAREVLRAWMARGCPDDEAALDALELIDLTDEDLEEIFRARPARAVVVPFAGRVR